jgi:hypothetical protein
MHDQECLYDWKTEYCGVESNSNESGIIQVLNRVRSKIYIIKALHASVNLVVFVLSYSYDACSQISQEKTAQPLQ